MVSFGQAFNAENRLAHFIRESVASWNASMSAGQPAPSRLTLFAIVFAWSGILHLLSFSDWMREFRCIEYLGFFLNLALAVRPSSLPLFLAAVLQRIAYTVAWIPMLRGHLFLEGLLVLGISIPLFVGLWRIKKTRVLTPDQQESVFESFAPFLRVSCIVVYLAVTLSKLNTGFIDRNESAAVQLLFWTSQSSSWVPTGYLAQQVAIWGTLVIEGGLPFLLLFRRTRLSGIVIALLFHALLVLVPLKIASFSITMCLLLASWLPRDCPQPIFDTYHRIRNLTRLPPFAFTVLVGAIVFATSLIYAVASGPLALRPFALYLGLGAWWWQFVIMLAVLASIRKVPAEPTRKILKLHTWPVRLLVGFMIFNCLCPYLGLKTRSALAMHCNLRTEPGYWNHFVIPESVRVFSLQDNLVTIVDSNHPDFKWLMEREMKLPHYEFRRWCRLTKDDFFVTYTESDNQVRHFCMSGGIGSDPGLIRYNSMLEWFLCFNPVGSTHDFIPGLTKRTGPARNVVPHFKVPD